ncbi:MAG: metallopeptidase family protein [Nitriliruptor sp.]
MRDDRHARHRRADADRRRRPVDGHRARDRARFERLAVDALTELPVALRAHLEGVVLTIEDVPPARPETEVQLGRYEAGTRHRADADRVALYRRPLEARAHARHDLAELIRVVVVDLLADHLGLDDDDLGALGWG